MKISKSLLGMSLAAPLAACNNTAKQPNIIFFLVDDYSWADSSVAYGDRVYPENLRFDTPNMKRLSEMGVIMTSAYACPVSTPTRTCMMTGMHAVHEHITSFTAPLPDIPTDGAGGGKLATIYDNEEDPFIRGEWNWNGISPVEGVRQTQYATPMVQLLRDAGYYTVHVGKAHWAASGTPGATPYNMGFLVQIGGTSVGHPQSYQSEDHYGNKPGMWTYAAVQNLVQYYDTGTHLTDAITKEALRAVEYPISKGQPFYLYMSHFAVHTPIQPDSRYYQKYRDRGMDEGQARYASMVEGVDASLGEIMKFIEEKGIADNTIIVFYADNGGHSVDYSKGGEPHTQSLPLREGKGSCYEGGIRVPMMFYIPGKTAAGTRINTPVAAEDIFPTILEMAGITDPKTVQTTDGQSLVRLVTDGSQYVAKAAAEGKITNQMEATHFVVPESVSGLDPLRPIVSHYPHQWRVEDQPDIDFLSAIREGDWKLVYRMHDFKLELYNLREDIGEHNDVAAEHKDIVDKLAKDLGDKLRGWDATMPIVRATGKPVPMPDEL